jgi:hypothetical protein
LAVVAEEVLAAITDVQAALAEDLLTQGMDTEKELLVKVTVELHPQFLGPEAEAEVLDLSEKTEETLVADQTTLVAVVKE